MPIDPAMALPLDVLTDIFLLACRLQVADPGVWEFLTPWAITEVSRSWRNIALSTPLLWSIITLRCLAHMSSESAKLWLSYSAECPLTLDLLPSSVFLEYDPFLVLHPHLSRVRELTIAHPYDIPEDPPLSSLEYLNLVWHSHNAKEGAQGGAELKHLRGLLEDTPRLRAIRVTTDFLPAFKHVSAKLVELNLSLQVPVTELYEFLSACPDLTVLKFGCSTNYKTVEDVPSSPIVLENLKVLSTEMIGRNDVQCCILRGLLTPRLSEGAFQWREGELGRSILQPLLTKSTCLHSLSLRCLDTSGYYMIEMLRQLPSLAAFTLSHVSTLDDYFTGARKTRPTDLLMEQLKHDCSQPSSNILLPRLKYLSIDTPPADIKEELFLDMVESRCLVFCQFTGDNVYKHPLHVESHITPLEEVSMSWEPSDYGLRRVDALRRAGLCVTTAKSFAIAR